MIENFWDIRNWIEQHQLSLSMIAAAAFGFLILFMYSFRELVSWFLRIPSLNKDLKEVRMELAVVKGLLQQHIQNQKSEAKSENHSSVETPAAKQEQVNEKHISNTNIESRSGFSIFEKQKAATSAAPKKDLFVFTTDSDKTL